MAKPPLHPKNITWLSIDLELIRTTWIHPNPTLTFHTIQVQLKVELTWLYNSYTQEFFHN